MTPKSLLESYVENKRKHILKKGMELMLKYGIKKTSVDEIIKAADIAKGTFYLYFTSRKDFFTQLFWDFYQGYTTAVEQMILEEETEDLKIKLKNFFSKLLNMPEFKFLFSNHKELEEYMGNVYNANSDFKNTENRTFEKLLILAGVDISNVKPGVVHNYLHAIFAMSLEDIMVKKDIQETFDIMIDGLINYIFGGKNEAV